MGNSKNLTKIDPKIQKFARKFGIKFYVGESPKKVGLNFDIPDDVVACTFPLGVIFVRKYSRYTQSEMRTICLHEIGHSILDLFPVSHPMPLEEVMANGIALAFHAYLEIPAKKSMVFSLNNFHKKIYRNHIKKNGYVRRISDVS